FVGGKMVSTYRLRDWGISRQRYWGCPIPIVYDPEGKAHPVPDEHLPWILPTDVDHTPDGTAPLARSKELFERTERLFGKGWKPEVETMDTFVDSSWYFYRYLDNKNDTSFADAKKMDAWMPIDLYMGGAEHTTMHLLYSRFWTKALYDLGFVKDVEAYKVRRNRGLILGPDGNKMSKSKGNVINPDEIVDRLGADTVRMYLAFMGPYGITANYPWDPNGVVGVRRFLERVWKSKEKISDVQENKIIHKIIKKITEDIEEHKYNTAISAMMILLNEWDKQESISKQDYKTLLQLLAPFAPHITEELWHQLGEGESIHLSVWPKYDESLVIEDQVTVGVQINGKLRAEITLAKDMDTKEVEKMVLELPKIKEYTEGKDINKIIVVPNRIINIVISS
ncbi:MAG TPA: class I tRNA ligase family protein, partial [Candidatus Paceibacterota bacterium]|nr:class I tRNA ligase family protein [Candidatus Paceibacterota bacterium]